MAKIPPSSHDAAQEQYWRTASIDDVLDLRIPPLRLPITAQTPLGAPSPIEPNTLLAPLDGIAPGLTIARPDPGTGAYYHAPARVPTQQELLSAARKRRYAEDEDAPGHENDTGASMTFSRSVDDTFTHEMDILSHLFNSKPLLKEPSSREQSLYKASPMFSGPSSFLSSPPSSYLPPLLPTTEGSSEMRRFLSLEEIAPSYRSPCIDPIFEDSCIIDNEPLNQLHLQLPPPRTQQETQKLPSFGPLSVVNELHEPPPDPGKSPRIDSLSSFMLPELRLCDSYSGQADDEFFQQARCPERQSSPRHELSGMTQKLLDKVSYIDERHRVENTKKQAGASGDMVLDSSTKQADQMPPKVDWLNSAKTRARPVKRRWTEKETQDLICGVMRCGVGNWKAILNQPDLNFGGRSALNLKDRFRVCCPWVYRGDSEQDHVGEETHGGTVADNTIPKTKTIRNFDRSKSRLIALGIENPTTTLRSSRRPRRYFTPEEDAALYAGFQVYGFRWAAILKDERLKFRDRKPGDLRDRFRVKYSELYKKG